jgi:hypothetical protein
MWASPIGNAEQVLRIVLTVALIAAPTPVSNAQPVIIASWMTRQRLIDLLQHPPRVRNKLQLTPADYLKEQTAESYIDGVKDATEGKEWRSHNSTRGPDDFHDKVIAELKSMPARQLKRSASSFIAEVLRKRYPYPPRLGMRHDPKKITAV